MNDEFDSIENSSTQLQYTKSFIQYAKIKALKIHKSKCSPEIQNNNFSNDNALHGFINLPNNSTTNIIEKKLNYLGIKTVTNSSKTIRNLINDKNNNNHMESRVGVYEIACLDCNKKCG